MPRNPIFAGNFDMASLIFGTFVAFFFGLILYLRREDRREGYPLEDDVTGKTEPMGGLFFVAQPKTFHLSGGGSVIKPDYTRDGPVANLRQTARVSGSPFEPVGNPMAAGVGPGAYAQRSKEPEQMHHGGPKVVPLRAAESFWIDGRLDDPRGMTVVAADWVNAGVVVDCWVDQAEALIRYLEVELSAETGAAGRHVLVPMPMSVIKKSNRPAERRVKVDSILAKQFSGVPQLSNPTSVTVDEEERIAAYFGGGLLYATPGRTEPLL
jgi:photosynthetic reaction center H subunit